MKNTITTRVFVLLCMVASLIWLLKPIYEHPTIIVVNQSVNNKSNLAIVMLSDEDVDDPRPTHHNRIYIQSLSNKRYYANMHGYELILDTQIDQDRHFVWSKFLVLHSYMKSRKDM